MIVIKEKTIKRQKNFWNHCLFHPTDAIEDPWGKKIIDRMADDGAVKSIRIYTMFEDIVYIDANGDIAYDFRLSDLRMDYLVEKGYNLLLAYAMMPECIASDANAKSCVSKNKTRYKGKLINTSPPKDYKIWEDICYEYTRHIVERYGEGIVSKWRVQCFNEPDIPLFFMSDTSEEDVSIRVEEYSKLYSAFVSGVSRATKTIKVGGPAIAYTREFLEQFLEYIKGSGDRLDFISMHNYAGTSPQRLNEENRGFSVENWLKTQEKYMDVIARCGFGDREVIVDEWGMASHGFYNIEECPSFISRDTEVFSAYFIRLIYEIIKKGWNLGRLMICLSGQHEMITDFSGFRNFFTLNFFAKPIYNAYVLASRLHNDIIDVELDNENVIVIPTRSTDGDYSVIVSYSDNKFCDTLPAITEEVTFDKDVSDKNVIIYCIDKNTTNPYRLYERMKFKDLGAEEIAELRNEGNITPIATFKANEKINLKLTANAVYLMEVK